MGLGQHEQRAIQASIPGTFIVLEGIDGVGKSTQHARLIRWLRSLDIPVCDVREPGGTAIGERIRELLLDLSHDEMAARCEVMLYMASRAQLIDEVIAPALAARQAVVSDRFAQSTIAYQGAGGAVPPADIERIARIACGEVWPDLIIIYDLDDSAARTRLTDAPDRMESKNRAYRARVRSAYLDLARAEPARHAVIDASAEEDAVFEQTLTALARWAQTRQSPSDR